MKVGIAGGIGSGKSYVCKRLAIRGIKVYDCDAAAKRLMRTSPTLQADIKALVGSMEKAAISKFLLASEDNQKAINSIIHPAVFRDFQESGMEWMESQSPGREDSPGERNGNLLQYFCWVNPIDRGAWWATVHGITKRSDMT